MTEQERGPAPRIGRVEIIRKDAEGNILGVVVLEDEETEDGRDEHRGD